MGQIRIFSGVGWISALGLVACLSMAWAVDGASPAGVPGSVAGERLVYNVHWSGFPVPAGTGVLEHVSGPAAEEGAPGSYRLRAALRSIGVAHAFYSVEDVLEAEGSGSGAGMRVLRFSRQQQDKNGVQKRTSHLFNRPGGEVTRTGTGERMLAPVVLPEQAAVDANDPLTAFYAFRGLPKLSPSFKMESTLVYGSKVYTAHVTVGDRMPLFTALGWFDVIPVEMYVPQSTVLRQPGSMTIWLTDDERRLPVRVKSRVRLGSVVADLMEFTDGRGERRTADPDRDDRRP
jgi:hypothetical protein